MPEYTPPAATLSITSPTLLRRLAAMVYDSLLLCAITILYGFVVVAINLLVQGAPDEGQRLSWGHTGPLVFSGWVASLIGFFCYFWSRAGQTLGMKTWKIHLVTRQGGQPSVGQCLLRCGGALLSAALLGAGYLWALVDREGQTLHDHLSNTRTTMAKK